MTEWRDVVGWEGLYRVSDDGQMWSVRRGRLVKPAPNTTGYLRAELWMGGKRTRVSVHVAMLEAFVGPRPEGMFGLHADDDRNNNTIGNLRWDTPTANNLDAIGNGRRVFEPLAECAKGHAMTPDNVAWMPGSKPRADGTPASKRRNCRQCRRDRQRANRRKAAA